MLHLFLGHIFLEKLWQQFTTGGKLQFVIVDDRAQVPGQDYHPGSFGRPRPHIRAHQTGHFGARSLEQGHEVEEVGPRDVRHLQVERPDQDAVELGHGHLSVGRRGDQGRDVRHLSGHNLHIA